MFLTEEINNSKITTNIECIHCGSHCPAKPISNEFGSFCCNGCCTVYEMLHEAGFDKYYSINSKPGTVPVKEDYSILDQKEVLESFIQYKDQLKSKVTLKIPAIHCASCVWLLERLNQLLKGVIDSRVNLGKREAIITFNHEETGLSEIFTYLSSLGYAPEITLSDKKEDSKSLRNPKLIKKTALAGFCFGNIMLFSFPAYFGLEVNSFYKFFGIMNALLTLPVISYCASDYWKSAKVFLSQKLVSVDLPIFIGLVAFTIQSYYEVLSGTGEGYFDSLTGLVFFLLCGKIFQDKLHQNLCFDRDYKSFFPLWSRKILDDKEENTLVNKLQKDDILRVRQNELIPCDSELISRKAKIDYSFVTGEYEPVSLTCGDKIYAGGRQVGESIDLKVLKECSSSYLTGLWNDLKNQDKTFVNFSDKISRYFTPAILLLALIFGSCWYTVSISASISVFISILIIACPCALALSAPFTYGFAGRSLNKFKLYLKNGKVIEKLSNCNAVVFDKTGTLSTKKSAPITFSGCLNDKDRKAIFSLCSQSLHPVSKQICNCLNSTTVPIDFFTEIPGKGIKGAVDGRDIIIGSPKLASYQADYGTWVKIDGEIIGFFNSKNIYREGLENTIAELGKNCELFLLSGDNPSEKENLEETYGNQLQMFFNQSPQQKMNFINTLREKGYKPLMIGDGLNDAGALKSAEVGIAVTEDISHFFPACDALLDANQLKNMHKFKKFSNWSLRVIHFNFALSLIYNIVGISAAALGLISPLFCAILMPASSFTILLSSALGTYIGSQIHLKETSS